jgi:FkbM family methyltransferase
MKSFVIRHTILSFLLDIDIKGVRKLAAMLPYLLIPKPKAEIVLKSLYGFSLKLNPVIDKGVEHSLYYTGTYEKGCLHIIKALLKNGDTFIDIGANIGLMSIYASTIVGDSGKVIAFEPNPQTYNILLENIAINKLTNIETHAVAIGDKKETSIIYDNWESNRGSASLIKPTQSGNSYEIAVCKLTDCIDIKQNITLIKIDVEGYELNVLQGAHEILCAENAPMLIVECSEMRPNSNENAAQLVYDFIKNSNDYRFFKSLSGKGRVSKLVEIKDISELPKHDNMYCFTTKQLTKINRNIFAKATKKILL